MKKDDLPALEYVTQNLTERVNVGVMMAGQGYIPDVWSATDKFLKSRDEKVRAIWNLEEFSEFSKFQKSFLIIQFVSFIST